MSGQFHSSNNAVRNVCPDHKQKKIENGILSLLTGQSLNMPLMMTTGIELCFAARATIFAPLGPTNPPLAYYIMAHNRGGEKKPVFIV
jgi:hypothetical protein